MDYFIITGATSGIGRAIAQALAEKGYPLILVARTKTQLQDVAKELKVPTQVMDLDLSEPGSALKLYEACKPYKVKGLVNNAGIGLFGEFADIDMEAERKLLQLNLITLHELCKYFLQDFQAGGMILNVGSTAAFQAGPYMASYYASKAYVLSLTEALAEEYPHLKISCLAPGPVRTGFHQRAGIQAGDKKLPTAQQVATYGIKKWFQGQVLIVPGTSNRLLLTLNRLIPRHVGRRLVLKNQLKKKI